MTGDNEHKPYTATTLASAAGVSVAYIARLCRQGKIPATKLHPTAWIIQYEDGRRWLEEREAKQEAKQQKPDES